MTWAHKSVSPLAVSKRQGRLRIRGGTNRVYSRGTFLILRKHMVRKRRLIDVGGQPTRGDRRSAPRGGRRSSDQLALAAALETTRAELRALTPRGAPLILVVDDFTDGRELTYEYLAFLGFQVEQASTGAETLIKASALRPHLILLDLALPDMDGLDVIARLHDSVETSTISIAVFTAHAGNAVRQRAMQAGAVMFIP